MDGEFSYWYGILVLTFPILSATARLSWYQVHTALLPARTHASFRGGHAGDPRPRPQVALSPTAGNSYESDAAPPTKPTFARAWRLTHCGTTVWATALGLVQRPCMTGRPCSRQSQVRLTQRRARQYFAGGRPFQWAHRDGGPASHAGQRRMRNCRSRCCLAGRPATVHTRGPQRCHNRHFLLVAGWPAVRMRATAMPPSLPLYWPYTLACGRATAAVVTAASPACLHVRN